VSISIVCPVFNKMEVTLDFVLNMLQYVKPPHQILIVANGCTDATVPFLRNMKRDDRPLEFVVADKNLGFAGGNNLGANVAANDNILFLSNDVRATGPFCDEVDAALNANPNAVIGNRLLSHDTGWNTYIAGRDMTVRGINVTKGTPVTVPYIEGWCLAVNRIRAHHNRASKKGDVGGVWDERYFPCDFEDMDLSWQALAEDKLLIQRDFALKHEHTGQTANDIAGGRLQVTLRNQKEFMEKWGFVKE